MEIHYIRKLMTSHMVVEQIACLSEWEEKMIFYAQLPGILFAECVCENGKSNLWYDITGKQSLDVVLEGRGLEHNLLCRILMGIYEAAEGVDGILLKSENMLLLPECIYLDYEMKEIYFCYYPNNMMPIAEAFLQLMEYLLTKLVHEDEKAVELAYGIYEQAAKKGWSLYQLKESISLVYQAEEEPVEAASDMWTAEMPVPEKRLECMCRIRKLLRDHLPMEIQRLLQKKVRAKVSPEEEERFVFEPDEEMEAEPASRPTVLLAQLNKPIEGILRYEGCGNCENLVIEGDEYLIGSDRVCAGYIPSDTVSRKHAKVIRIGDVYMIEDLNSSNGTYVGGELLNYKTKVSLQKNEIVIFADEKFRFI